MSQSLREYQQEIVDDVMSSTDDILIGLPTGSGKTIIAKELAKRIKEPILFVAPRIDLIQQAEDKFEEECDIVWGNRTSLTGKHITIASKPSLVTRLDDVIKSIQNPVIIFDEAHVGLETNKHIVDTIPHTRVIGLTATPERMSGQSFIKHDASFISNYKKDHKTNGTRYDCGMYDTCKYYYGIPELTKLGFLSDINVKKYKTDLTSICSKQKKLGKEEISGHDLQQWGNYGQSIVDLVSAANLCKGAPTIIFTPTIKVAQDVLSSLDEKNLHYEVITGDASEDERKVAYAKLSSNEIDGLVNASLLTYGFDCPSAKNAILFRHILSRPLFMQICGRILRPYNGETATLYDILDSESEFTDVSQLDLFKYDVNWRYDGFDRKEDDAQHDEDAQRLDKLESLDDDGDWLERYKKDPIHTLWSMLDKLEERVSSDDEYKASCKNSIDDLSSKIEKLIVENAELYQENSKLKQRGYATSTSSYTPPPTVWNWVKTRAFDELKTKAPKVLRESNYDSSEFQTRGAEMQRKIMEYSMPKGILLGASEDDIIKTMNSMTSWWVRNFKKDYIK